MSTLTVERLYNSRHQELELTALNSDQAGMEKDIRHPDLHRPGLALTGFFERFSNRRIQILGETEMAYLSRLTVERLEEISRQLFERDIPMVIVTKGIAPRAEFTKAADRFHTGVFSSRLTTIELINRLSAYLDYVFAPSIIVHGTLVDVYGVGLLYTGKSGIGKSEVALDLVERGHRLVADDVIRINRRGADVIIGTGAELLGHHMEIRGVGIIDIEELFGIRAIRLQKRIEVEVNLALWSETEEYERLGMEDKRTTILGVEIPYVRVPVSPGKNITVVSEVIGMNHMLKIYGKNSAVEFSEKLSQRLSRQSSIRDYLESDLE